MDINALFKAAAAPITQVTDLQSASTVAKELSELRERAQAIEDDYAVKIDEMLGQVELLRIECAEQVGPLIREINEKKDLLTDFHRHEYERAEDKDKVKSIKLPHGVTLSSRSAQPSFAVKDETAYRAFAQRAGLIKTVENVDWSTMKKQLSLHNGKVIHETTGEVVEFIEVEAKERSFDVK